MLPAGGYDVKLLCPPNTLHLNLDYNEMLARGATPAGPCWDMSDADVVEGLFRYQVPPAAVTFEVTGATDLSRMFAENYFDQRVALTGLGNVQSTERMFHKAARFNSPLSLQGLGSTGKWTSAYSMFGGAVDFNQPIDAIGNSSAVTNFNNMFFQARSFNQPVPFDTRSAINMQGMFEGAWNFNQPVAFDTSRVTVLTSMFNGAAAFNQPVGDWNTSAATIMFRLFFEADRFNQPLASWDTSSVTIMRFLFYRALDFAQELEAWDVRMVTDFAYMFKYSRMASEAVSGGPGFGRACRLHHSWKAQPACWDPVDAGLVANAAELDLSLCAPYLAGGALQGDPHLGLAHGGKADFRGCDGCLFSFLSTRDVSVNARLRAATFTLRGSEVHGTFVTEVHVATLDRASGAWFTASYWADEVGANNWGWRAVNATCGGRTSTVMHHTTRACAGGSVTVDLSSAVFALPDWEVRVDPRPVYGRIDGPVHRLDLSLRPLLPEGRLAEWPHGLIGQSFDGDARPRQGKQDDYSAPVVWTTAQAEGAIEGGADNYRVASPFATAFRFSRFDPLPSGAQRGPAPVASKSGWAPESEAAPGPAPAGVATAGEDA